MARTATTRRTSRITITMVALAAILVAGLVHTGSASAATCSTPWGSRDRWTLTRTTTPMLGARAGRHSCFDRLVLDLGPGRAPGYAVRYLPSHQKGILTGELGETPVHGGAILMVIVLASAYDAQGRPTYVPPRSREMVNVTAYSTFRHVVWAGTGYPGDRSGFTVGIGVRTKLPFRVFTLHDDTRNRLVIDVAHRG